MHTSYVNARNPMVSYVLTSEPFGITAKPRITLMLIAVYATVSVSMIPGPVETKCSKVQVTFLRNN
jgi:hypothetical protein